MLTKKDKKEIKEIVETVVFKSQSKLYDDMISLFTATNERIDLINNEIKKIKLELEKINNKLDGVNDHLRDHHIIKTYDKRIEELADKVFNTTS